MAEENKKEEMTQVSLKILTDIQEKMAENERKMEDLEAKNAGLEELLQKGAGTEGEPRLREKRSFEPKFRTVRLRKYPIAGDVTNLGYVIGWDNRGAYQEVDRNGVSPTLVDYINIIFLDHEKTSDGKIKAEKVRLLDLLNNGQQVHCKILDTKTKPVQFPTGEEIDISIYDPAHGMVSTGEKIDGYIVVSDTEYKLQVPGHDDGVWIDAEFCN